MLEIIPVDEALTLDDYDAYANLAPAVRALRDEAEQLVSKLEGRTVWMVNSTARGGGVAEMLPRLISILRELGVSTEWAVIGTDDTRFFDFTKRVHNLIHGEGTPDISADERSLFEAVNRKNADELKARIKPNDILAVHDPQPIALGKTLGDELGVCTLWRCHIGLPERTPQTKSVWRFLRDYATGYDWSLFSAPEYIPGFLAGRSAILHPALDPLSQKNRELHPHRLLGILCNGGLAKAHGQLVTPAFNEQAKRLQADGSWMPAHVGDLELVYRPIVTQVSRWDRLKGWLPLLKAFTALKSRVTQSASLLHRRRMQIVRLVLAGPDPSSISDDPEGLEVLEELCAAYQALPADIQGDVALISLPMGSRKENALMVNAIQRCSTMVVQNSLREGFGLTATEAMWKRVPVLGSSACGLRQQIRDGIDGRLVGDANDVEALAGAIDALLEDKAERERMGRNAQRRVHGHFLVFSQVSHWLHALVNAIERHEA